MVTALNQLCGTYKFRIKRDFAFSRVYPNPSSLLARKRQPVKVSRQQASRMSRRTKDSPSLSLRITLADNTYGLALKLLSATGDGNSERLAALDAALAQIKKALAREAK
jgi:hypothetical protein